MPPPDVAALPAPIPEAIVRSISKCYDCEKHKKGCKVRLTGPPCEHCRNRRGHSECHASPSQDEVTPHLFSAEDYPLVMVLERFQRHWSFVQPSSEQKDAAKLIEKLLESAKRGIAKLWKPTGGHWELFDHPPNDRLALQQVFTLLQSQLPKHISSPFPIAINDNEVNTQIISGANLRPVRHEVAEPTAPHNLVGTTSLGLPDEHIEDLGVRNRILGGSMVSLGDPEYVISVPGFVTGGHIDVLSCDIIATHIIGPKCWIGYPPTQPNLTWMGVNRTDIPSTSNLVETFEKLEGVTVGVFEAGDTIRVPAGWTHQVLSPVTTLCVGNYYVEDPVQVGVEQASRRVEEMKEYFEWLIGCVGREWGRSNSSMGIENIVSDELGYLWRWVQAVKPFDKDFAKALAAIFRTYVQRLKIGKADMEKLKRGLALVSYKVRASQQPNPFAVA